MPLNPSPSADPASATAPATITPTPLDQVPADRLATSADGFVYDTLTGEVLGIDRDELDEGHGVFEVVDEDGVEWVLERLSEAEAAVVALEARERALVANLRRKAGWFRSVAAFLRWRYGRGLERVARAQMDRTGKRTAIFAHGRVEVRRQPGRTEIVVPDEAIAFVREWSPELLQPKPVTLRALEAAKAAYRKACQEEPDTAAFAAEHGPSEKVTVRTGVIPDGGKDAA